MFRPKPFMTLAAAAGLVVMLPAMASAAWNKSVAGTGRAAASSVQSPATASAAPTTGATDTSMTVNWTAPSGGPTPTGYRVDRVSPAGTVCTVGSATLTCNDTGRTASTSYSYTVRALVSNWNGTTTAASSSTSATADTTAPTMTANCPTAAHAAYQTGNNGGNSWHGICADAATVNASDNVAVTSAAIKIQNGTTCFTGSTFTTAQCTAAGPSGYPVGYLSAAKGSGTAWSVAITNGQLGAGGSFTLSAQAKDAAANTSTTLSVAFTTS